MATLFNREDSLGIALLDVCFLLSQSLFNMEMREED